MTKEQLKKYRTLKAELADLELDIKSKTLHDSVQRSKREFPYTFGHDHIEGVPDEGVLDDHYDLLIRKSDLKAQIREIEEFVNGIEDNIVHKSIALKYIIIEKDKKGNIKPPPKWYQIAYKVNCGLSGDGIRMKVYRFLKKYLVLFVLFVLSVI